MYNWGTVCPILNNAFLSLVSTHRKLNHEGVHNAPDDRDEVERVPAVPKVALPLTNESVRFTNKVRAVLHWLSKRQSLCHYFPFAHHNSYDIDISSQHNDNQDSSSMSSQRKSWSWLRPSGALMSMWVWGRGRSRIYVKWFDKYEKLFSRNHTISRAPCKSRRG